MMKWIAYIFLALGLVFFSIDLYYYFAGGKLGAISIAVILFKIKSSYLPLIQAVTERYISVYLWDNLVYPLISFPVWAICWAISFILRIILAIKAHKTQKNNQTE